MPGFIERKKEVYTLPMRYAMTDPSVNRSLVAGMRCLKTPDEGGTSTYGSEIPRLKEVRRASEHD